MRGVRAPTVERCTTVTLSIDDRRIPNVVTIPIIRRTR